MLRDDDITRRVLSGSRRRGWHKLSTVLSRTLSVGSFTVRRDSSHPEREKWTVLLPILLTGVLALSLVFFVSISLPRVSGPRLDHSEYYYELSVADALLPRAMLIGLVAGVVIFTVAVQLEDRMAWIFSAGTVSLIALAGILALAILIGHGAPNSTYLGANAGEIFLVVLLPIGVPVVVGAVLGAAAATA